MGGGREGLVRTVCTCALISRHSGNSVLRMDNSVFQRHYLILSGLLLGSLRERENSQYTSTEKCSHSLSSFFTTCLWNTGKPTLSRVLSPRLYGSLPDLTEGLCYTLQRLNRKTARLVATLHWHRGHAQDSTPLFILFAARQLNYSVLLFEFQTQG